MTPPTADDASPLTLPKVGWTGRWAARARVSVGLRDAVLYGWFFLTLLLVIQPHLIFQTCSPAFAYAPEDLAGYARASGGPILALSLILGQLLAHDLAGALLLTLEAALIASLAHRIFAALAGRPVPVVRYVPAILFMLLCGRYEQSLAAGPMMIATLAAVLLFVSAPVRSRPARVGLYLLLAAGVYYGVAGASGKLLLALVMLLFSFLCALYEARRGPRRPAGIAWGAAWLALAAGITYAGEKWLLRGDVREWAAWRPEAWDWTNALPVSLFAVLPVLAMPVALGVVGLLERILRQRAPEGAPAKPAVSPTLLWVLQTAALLWVASSLALNVAADRSGRRAARTDYYITHRMWAPFLAMARETPSSERDDLFNHDVDTALFFTGQLTSDMFAYGPHPAPMLLPLEEPDSWPYLSRLSTVLLRLGRVSDAEHFAYESLHIVGERPEILQQLTTIHLAKGELPAAELVLNRLRCYLGYRHWAAQRLALMARDPSLSSDEEIRRIREVMLTDDDVQDVIRIEDRPGGEIRVLPERMLLNLLARNPKNRMAFEYLMGMYLLDGQLGRFAQNLHRLDDFGDKEIPPLYEEALLVYLDMGGHLPELHGRTISRASLNGFRAIKATLRRNGDSPQRAYPEMTAGFANTYSYYLLYRKGGR